MFYRILRGTLRFLLAILNGNAHYENRDKLPTDTSYILVAPHRTWIDPVYLAIAASPKPFTFMAKKELFKSAFMRFLAHLYGIFSVDRSGKDIEAIKTSLKILKNGEVLGIFPEGTRNGLEKNGDVKNGAAYMAIKTGKPVIPVGIKGNFKPFTKVIVTYGKPIDFTEYQTKDKAQEKENLEKVSDIIMDNIISLTK